MATRTAEALYEDLWQILKDRVQSYNTFNFGDDQFLEDNPGIDDFRKLLLYRKLYESEEVKDIISDKIIEQACEMFLQNISRLESSEPSLCRELMELYHVAKENKYADKLPDITEEMLKKLQEFSVIHFQIQELQPFILPEQRSKAWHKVGAAFREEELIKQANPIIEQIWKMVKRAVSGEAVIDAARKIQVSGENVSGEISINDVIRLVQPNFDMLAIFTLKPPPETGIKPEDNKIIGLSHPSLVKDPEVSGDSKDVEVDEYEAPDLKLIKGGPRVNRVIDLNEVIGGEHKFEERLVLEVGEGEVWTMFHFDGVHDQKMKQVFEDAAEGLNEVTTFNVNVEEGSDKADGTKFIIINVTTPEFDLKDREIEPALAFLRNALLESIKVVFPERESFVELGEAEKAVALEFFYAVDEALESAAKAKGRVVRYEGLENMRDLLRNVLGPENPGDPVPPPPQYQGAEAVRKLEDDIAKGDQSTSLAPRQMARGLRAELEKAIDSGVFGDIERGMSR